MRTRFPTRDASVGVAQASRVLVSGVAPKHSLLVQRLVYKECARKVRDREDAFANTRDACATLNARRGQ